MAKQQQPGGVSRGEIVWVRVSFPQKWWPALVLCTDDLGVLVSFFDHQNLSPRYFIESDVISFENSFRSLLSYHKKVDDTETFYVLLDSALKLLGRRVISSLKCPCQTTRRDESDGGNNGGEHFDGFNSFKPLGLLGFVRQVAVFPWVDAPDFADAIRAIAQVQAFRGYCSIKWKLVHKENRMRGQQVGNKLKLHSCTPLDENMDSIIQEPGALEPNNECLIQSKELEKDLDVRTIGRFNSEVPIVKGNSENFYEKQLLITPQTLAKQRKAEYLKEITFHLLSLGLDAFYLLGTCTQSVEQSLLRFQNISDQDFSFPGNSKTQLSGYVSRRKGNSEELCLSLPDIASAIYLTRKRRLDQPAAYDYSFKLRRIGSCSLTSEAYSSPQCKQDISDIFILSSALASCFTNSGNHMEFFQDFLSQAPVKLIQDLCFNRGLFETYIFGNSRMNLLTNESSCMSLLKDASHTVGFPEIDRVQQTKRNAHITRDTKLSCMNMLEAGSIKQDNQSCIFYCETKMNFIDGIQKKDPKGSHTLTLHQSFTREPLFGSMPAFNSNNYEDDAGAATTKASLGFGSTDDQISSKIISNGDTTTKIKSSARKNNKCLGPSSASYSMAGQQSKPHAPVASGTSLHMKFPKNFNLPSKEELMKMFSVFGTIDSLKTRVFNWRSSGGFSPGS